MKRDHDMGENSELNTRAPEPLVVMEAVVKAVRDTFENMVFSEPEPAGAAISLSVPTLGVALQVNEPFCLKVVMVMSEELAQKIGALIFRHEEEGDTAAAMRDAVSELLNTLTGKMMRELVPGDRLFSLDFPYLWRPEDEVGRPADLQCPFTIEGLPLHILLFGMIDIPEPAARH